MVKHNKTLEPIRNPDGFLLAQVNRYVSTKAPSLELSGFYKQK